MDHAPSERPSDVAALWEEALDAFFEISKVDIRSELSSQRSVATIMRDQEHQLDIFKDFRHNKGEVDKIRSIISDNASYIQSAANQIASAVSTAFPPSAAILTAFTCVMEASRQVSDSYNVIESFFDDMRSFFRRLSLLEGKIPSRKEFQHDLIKVFSSILAITAYAHYYCRQGRFRAWARALVNGKDPNLQETYDSLHENLKNLEKATMFQTLRTSIDMYDEAKATSENVKSMQESLDKNTLALVKHTYNLSVLIRRSQENEYSVQESLRTSRAQTKDSQLQHQLKSSKSRPANFARLKQLLLTAAEAGMQRRRQAELERATIRHVFEWIENDSAFLDIVNKRKRFLWVSGASGMGKSTMAFKMFCHLKGTFAGDPSVSVACFFFDQEYPEMRSLQNMLRWCSIQAAERDARYCEAALRDLSAVGDSATGVDKDWHNLIESKYWNDSQRRLIFVLDGIDEIEDQDLAKLAEIFIRVQGQNLEIQIIVTSDPSREEYLSQIFSKPIELVKQRIAGDMRRFASSQTKNLPRLQKLSPSFRKSIAKKVSAKADSFLYIVHAMRRLDGIGYEGAVGMELDILPSNTTALYETLLNDCQKNRSLEEREVLRSLLAWLAYAKSKLTFGGAVLLINIVRKKSSISMDEAFNGPLARLLRISSSGDGNLTDSDSSGYETDEVDSDDPENMAGIIEDADSFLHFQERSLRAYFRQAIGDPHVLKCTANEAHAIIFKIISTILTLESEYGATMLFYLPKACRSAAERILKHYAATWGLAHLCKIEVDKLGDELAKEVLESLFSILSNKKSCLKLLEAVTNRSSTILNGRGVEEDTVLGTLGSWARHTLRLPPGSIAHEVLEWFRPFAEEPRRVFIPIARAHINNWFFSEDVRAAYSAFSCAHYALFQGKDLPELPQTQMLRDYFDEFEKNGQKITEKSFEAISNAFADIAKTPTSFLGIAMAMFDVQLYREAVKQAEIGMGIGTILEAEQFWLFQCKGELLFELACLDENKEEKAKYLSKSVDTLGMAIKMYHKIEEANAATQDDRMTMVSTFNAHARAAARLGKLDLIIRSIKETVSSQFGIVDSDTLEDIISALLRANEHETGMEVLKAISKADLTAYFILSGYQSPNIVQEAAKRFGEARWLLGLYAAIAKGLAVNPQPYTKTIAMFLAVDPQPHTNFFKNSVQIQAACFAYQAMGDVEEAKRLLWEVIHDSQAYFDDIRFACQRLAELLFEDFRLSGEPMVKTAALEEMKELQGKLGEVLGSDCKAAELPTTVTLALMLRKLGPALELADVLQAAFQYCVRLLTDDIGYNDFHGFRHLAVVLSCVGGLGTYAQVALTAQLYVMDRDVREKDLAKRRLSGEKKEKEKEERGVSAEAPGPPGDSTGEDRSGATVRGEPATLADEMAEGLLGDSFFRCNLCSKEIRDWAHGGAYLCLHCIDCDICEECFAKKEARENGEMEPDWRVICPQGHQHIKAPVEGWRGVNDGRLRIGEEEVPFREWLKDLEMKWKASWDRYWLETDE
jgi:hypothetical protein